MLKLVECRPGRSQHEVSIDLENLPATIGKGQGDTYQMAVGVDPRSIYFQSLSRVHATLYREGDDIWLRDGNGKPSTNGVFFHGRRVYNPVRLYPGIQVDLFPDVKGYHLYIEHETTGGDGSEFATLGLEHEFLSQELKTADERVEELTWVVADLKKRLEVTSREDHDLKQSMEEIRADQRALKSAKSALQEQLNRLKRILIGIAVVAIASAWLLFGGDTEALELLGKAVISIVGLFSFVMGVKD